MKIKKTLSAFIAVSCILCGCQTADPSESFYEYENVLSEAGNMRGITIVACSLSTEEIRVPETVSGKKVLRIGCKKIGEGNYTGAFEGCPFNIKRIIIPEGVEEIEGNVFKDSVSLQNVILPESLEYLGPNAFSGCEGLTDITIPKNVSELIGNEFAGCINLERAELSEGITRIGHRTFADCTSLEKIELPSTVTDIESFAFVNCTSLSEVSLPEGLLSIGDSAFLNCGSINEITVPDTVEIIGEQAFSGCAEDIVIHYRGMDYVYPEIDNIYKEKK